MKDKLHKQKIKIRDMKKFDREKYSHDIKELDNLDLYQHNDGSKMLDPYQNKLNEMT